MFQHKIATTLCKSQQFLCFSIKYLEFLYTVQQEQHKPAFKNSQDFLIHTQLRKNVDKIFIANSSNIYQLKHQQQDLKQTLNSTVRQLNSVLNFKHAGEKTLLIDTFSEDQRTNFPLLQKKSLYLGIHLQHFHCYFSYVTFHPCGWVKDVHLISTNALQHPGIVFSLTHKPSYVYKML